MFSELYLLHAVTVVSAVTFGVSFPKFSKFFSILHTILWGFGCFRRLLRCSIKTQHRYENCWPLFNPHFGSLMLSYMRVVFDRNNLSKLSASVLMRSSVSVLSTFPFQRFWRGIYFITLSLRTVSLKKAQQKKSCAVSLSKNDFWKDRGLCFPNFGPELCLFLKGALANT